MPPAERTVTKVVNPLLALVADASVDGQSVDAEQPQQVRHEDAIYKQVRSKRSQCEGEDTRAAEDQGTARVALKNLTSKGHPLKQKYVAPPPKSVSPESNIFNDGGDGRTGTGEGLAVSELLSKKFSCELAVLKLFLQNSYNADEWVVIWEDHQHPQQQQQQQQQPPPAGSSGDKTLPVLTVGAAVKAAEKAVRYQMHRHDIVVKTMNARIQKLSRELVDETGSTKKRDKEVVAGVLAGRYVFACLVRPPLPARSLL
jgi:hypothetical protein